MFKKHRKIKCDKGAITIEALLSLSTFMFAVVTLLSVINICIVQARVSYAINATAKEISQYGYLYSLTGLLQSEQEIKKAGDDQVAPVGNILSEVNSVYNEIEKLASSDNYSADNIDDILNAWDGLQGSAESIQASGKNIYSEVMGIAKDPKSLLFGVAKLAAVEGFDLAKSKLICEPLAKAMCKKHLVNTNDGDVESYLRSLRIVPASNGSYYDGISFNGSTLFPNGTSTIRIVADYKVKMVALLPIDFTFHFHQQAITTGWLAGDVTFEKSATKQYVENSTMWTEAGINERQSYIRHQVIDSEKNAGYYKTAGLTDVQLYSEQENKFVMISSMNPLYTVEGAEPLTIDTMNELAIKENIERLTGKIISTTSKVDTVTVKIEGSDGSVKKETKDSKDAANKIILVVPEDEGLKEKIESIIAECDTKGVEFEVVAQYGNGARKTEVKEDSDKPKEEN